MATGAVQPYSVVYLECQLLRASAWPTVSAKLRNLLESAGLLRLPVIIPEPVERELEAQFLRDYEASLKVAAKGARSVLAILRRVGGPFEGQAFPEAAVVIEQYRAAAMAAKTAEGISTCPLTGITGTTLLDLLVQRRPPFNEEGKGLGDTFIYLSVIEHLKGVGGRGLLVTLDRDYRGAEAHTAASGVQLTTLPLEGALEALRQDFADTFKLILGGLERAARAVMEANRGYIAKYVRDTVEINPWQFSAAAGRFELFKDIEVHDVLKVRATPLFPSTGSVTTFTARLSSTIVLLVEAPTELPIQRIKVGGTLGEIIGMAERAELTRLMSEESRELSAEKKVDVELELGATATRTDDGWTDFVCTYVNIVEPRLPAILRLPRQS